jgi:hypothetical protein
MPTHRFMTRGTKPLITVFHKLFGLKKLKKKFKGHKSRWQGVFLGNAAL